MSKTRASGPAKPKAPSAKASPKTWKKYAEKVRQWRSIKRMIANALGVGKKKSGGKKRR